MNTIALEPEIDKIYDRFKAAGIVVEKGALRDRINTLLGYKVPLNEALKTVGNSLRKEHNIPFESMRQGEAPMAQITSIKEDNKWITIRGKIVQLWEPKSDLISQTGLIGDESGIIKFTIFAKSADAIGTILEEGKSYEFNNVVSSEWQGQMSVKVNKSSKITQLEEDIQANRQTTTVTGIISSVSPGSGLIKRCPECNMKLSKGSCINHGKVEGIFDLRLKACLIDSVPSIPPKGYDIIVNAETVTKITGITLDEAKEMATEALDTAIVSEVLTEKVLFRYYKVTGAQLPGNFIVRDMEPINGMAGLIAAETKKLLTSYTGGI